MTCSLFANRYCHCTSRRSPRRVFRCPHARFVDVTEETHVLRILFHHVLDDHFLRRRAWHQREAHSAIFTSRDHFSDHGARSIADELRSNAQVEHDSRHAWVIALGDAREMRGDLDGQERACLDRQVGALPNTKGRNAIGDVERVVAAFEMVRQRMETLHQSGAAL
jgi:hypothetical protein